MKRKFVKLVSVALSLVMSASILSACGKESEPSSPTGNNGEPQYKDTLVVGLALAPTTLDPSQKPMMTVNSIVHRLLHANLVSYNIDEQKIEADVAESWEISEDKKTYTFHIRKGVKFHNGDELKASDVKYTLERAKATGVANVLWNPIESLEVTDDYTMVAKLKTPSVDWLSELSTTRYGLVSEKACTKDPKHGFEIGCGPYKLNKFVLNDYVLFDKFADYWGAEDIHSNHIKVRTILDNSARLIALQNGEIDICMDPNTTELGIIKDDKKLKLAQYDASQVSFAAFNGDSKLASNLKLRQAIVCAINKEEIIAGAYDGLAIPANSVWGTTMYGLDENVQPYSFDLEKAKKLMEEAGYKDGLKLTVQTFPKTQKICEILQVQLSKIGIKLKINSQETAAFTALLREGNWDMAVLAYGASSPFGSTFYQDYTFDENRTNMLHYKNQEATDLMNQAAVEYDDAKRKALYSKVQAVTNETAYYFAFAHPKLAAGYVKNLQGFTPAAGGEHLFAKAYVLK